jgi:hypothetical protein
MSVLRLGRAAMSVALRFMRLGPLVSKPCCEDAPAAFSVALGGKLPYKQQRCTIKNYSKLCNGCAVQGRDAFVARKPSCSMWHRSLPMVSCENADLF